MVLITLLILAFVRCSHQVWSYDQNTAEWVLEEVLDTQERDYDGDVVTLKLEITGGGEGENKYEEVTCTGGHPFWVTQGVALEERPVCSELPVRESVMTSGGRWTEARWLRLGDHFLTRTGKSATVVGLTIRMERVQVYNLQVRNLQLYAVGHAGVLVHNKAGIYWFRGRWGGLWYVGEAVDITRRVAGHVRTGKLPKKNLGTLRTEEVLGGKGARLAAERAKIKELGGPNCVENLRNLPWD